jgi:acyl carrier protein
MKNLIIEMIATVTKQSSSYIEDNLTSKNLWDSFTHVELTLALEEKFNIIFDKDEITAMVTPELVIEVVLRRTQQ